MGEHRDIITTDSFFSQEITEDKEKENLEVRYAYLRQVLGAKLSGKITEETRATVRDNLKSLEASFDYYLENPKNNIHTLDLMALIRELINFYCTEKI